MMVALPVVLLLMAIPLGLLAATAWLWVRVVRGFATVDTDTPLCGKCGAGVRGIGSLTCPECGADLREVGIVTPQGRRAVPALVFILAWTCLPALPALIALAFLTAIGPSVSTTRLHLTLNDAPHVLVVDAVYHGPHVTGGMSTSTSSATVNGVRTATTTLGLPAANPASIDRLQLSLATPAGQTTLIYQPTPAAYRIAHPGHSATEAVPLAPVDIRDDLLLATNTTLPMTDPKLQGLTDLANALANGSSNVAMQGWAGSTSSSWGSSSRPAWWYLALLLIGFAAIYASGLVIFFRLRRRAVSLATPDGDATP
ncbi:MAG: hypothetical protein AAF842_01185 [Planctomycetota bacterium]